MLERAERATADSRARQRWQRRARWTAGRCVAALVLVWSALPCGAQADEPVSAPFSHGPWRLSLAWSPQFCHSAPEFSQELQCSTGVGFAPSEIVELPLASAGGCGMRSEGLSPENLGRFQDLMRNRRWGKIQATRRYPCGEAFGIENVLAGEYLYGTLKFPSFDTAGQRADQVSADAFIRDFRAINGWPDTVTIAPSCERGWLKAVAVCADSALRFQTCEATPGPQCPSTFKVRPTRSS